MCIRDSSNPISGQAASFRVRINQWRRGDSSDGDFNQIAIFGGFKRRFTAKNFRGGSVMAVMGGYEIDLRQAGIEGDSATIDATSIMGGGEIKVPDNWRISIDGIGLFGAYVDETHQLPATDATPQKHLIVKGIAFMGGVVIKN